MISFTEYERLTDEAFIAEGTVAGIRRGGYFNSELKLFLYCANGCHSVSRDQVKRLKIKRKRKGKDNEAR